MAKDRVFPHILIDALPAYRKMLDEQVPKGEPLPLLLTAQLVETLYHEGGKPSGGFLPSREDLEAKPLWGEDIRAKSFFPTHLIQSFWPKSDLRSLWPKSDPDSARWSDQYRELVQDAQIGLAELFEEARNYFGLGAHEPLRIACVGGRESLFRHSKSSRPQRRAEQLYLENTNSRLYAADLVRALKRIGNLRFEWLAQGFPGIGQALEQRAATTGLPWRYKWLAWRAQRAVGSAPGGETFPGTTTLVYYQKDLRWRCFPKRTDATGEVIRRFAADAPRGSRRRVMIIIVTPGAAQLSPFDNPILATGELELAAAAKIEAVLIDGKLGIYDDQSPPSDDPSMARLKAPPLPLPRLYRL